MTTGRLSPTPDATAPDGSEIRLAGQVRGGSMVHCTLPPGQTTQAVRHRTVEELWLVTGGRGEVWRQPEGGAGEVTPVQAGTWLTIPLGVRFQFRNVGVEPLTIVIATLPPWPGPDEAVAVENHWPRR
ncbi:MAG TPA: cupin domain-containing protein [bacterium]